MALVKISNEELSAEDLIEALESLSLEERIKFQEYLKQAFVWVKKELL